jgi:maleylacetate reductase
MTPVYGITRHSNGNAQKVTINDPKIAPKLVIYDPLLTLDVPPELTASSGINALAHCVEAVYSSTRNPPSTAAALSGTRYIYRALPRCYTNGDDLNARTAMQMGAHLAGLALSNVAMGLHHGLCHVLGGTAGVPHGIANAIILPHAMRFNADACARGLAQIAEAMGIAHDGRDDEELARVAAQRVYNLVGQMNLPQHLHEVGVKESDLPRLAELAAQSRTVQNNPKPVNAAQVEALLRAAW